MALEQLRILNNCFLNKDTDVVTGKVHLIILDIKSNVCMAGNGKDNHHTRQISRRIHFI